MCVCVCLHTCLHCTKLNFSTLHYTTLHWQWRDPPTPTGRRRPGVPMSLCSPRALSLTDCDPWGPRVPWSPQGAPRAPQGARWHFSRKCKFQKKKTHVAQHPSPRTWDTQGAPIRGPVSPLALPQAPLGAPRGPLAPPRDPLGPQGGPRVPWGPCWGSP